MILTNTKGLPEPIFQAIKFGDNYDGYGTLSVTTLIDPPKIWILKEKHKDEIHLDVTEMVWAMFGSACHAFIEGSKLADASRYVIERRMRFEVDGQVVSGKMDLLDLQGATFDKENLIIYGGKINDYKVSSVWSYTFRDEKAAWNNQLNWYATMLRNVGFMFTEKDVEEKTNFILGHECPINTPIRVYPSEASIILIVRDWVRKKAQYEIDYPQSQIIDISIPLIDDAALWERFLARIQYFIDIKKYIASGGSIHDVAFNCSDKDMWGTGVTYKVKSSASASRAYPYGSFSTKDYGSEAEAKAVAFARQKMAAGQTAYIDLVAAEYRRCSSFCTPREFCEQRKSLGIALT